MLSDERIIEIMNEAYGSELDEAIDDAIAKERRS